MDDQSRLYSWGLIPKVKSQQGLTLNEFKVPMMVETVLARGQGRSYGDSCLNEDGTLLLTKNLNHFLDFDSASGVLICESGVTLNEILKVFVPKGWFLPVTPGTKFVTIGGAISNDVHGKNHHRAGNFGHHVISFGLVRSDGVERVCSQNENSDLFRATIGGLGLTGLISWVKLKLRPIKSAMIDQEQIKFSSLSEFLKLSQESEKDFEYTVAWVDCINGEELRGIFIRGNHSEKGPLVTHEEPKLTIPFNFPNWILNKYTVQIFNHLYYGKNFKRMVQSQIHYENFFYPLDSVYHWNRIYGERGFFQYQFVVPFSLDGEKALRKILEKIKSSGMASFLVVLKTFGDISPVGTLSFPRAGITLALDFANSGTSLLKMLDECDLILNAVGGRVYPAKDARMQANFMHDSYNIKDFKQYIDPKFSSSFSRRVKL